MKLKITAANHILNAAYAARKSLKAKNITTSSVTRCAVNAPTNAGALHDNRGNVYLLKDCTHDYAVSAFVFYAHCGCPNDEDMHNIIRQWAEKNHDSLSVRNSRRKKRMLTEEDLIREKTSQIEQQLKSYLTDVSAVNQMLKEISETSMGDEKIRCIKYVYFCSGVNLKTRGNMSAIVRRCTVDTGLNESFIYRSLREARDIFVWRRGLHGNITMKMAEDVFGFAI